MEQEEKELNLSLTNDALFKDYYSNPDNLSVLLSLILGIKILPDEIIYENNEINTWQITIHVILSKTY